MVKSSPPVNVTEFDKAAVAAVETPTDADFISVSTSYVRMQNGKATVTNAYFPNWAHYDEGVVTFGDVSVTGSPTTATLEFRGLTRDGVQRTLGTSTFTNGAFPAIVFDNTYEKYYLFLSELSGGTSPDVTVATLLQGRFKEDSD